MKKILKIFLVAITLCLSVVFSACGDSYKDLKITSNFDSSYIQLVIDDEYYTSLGGAETERVNKKVAQVIVEFSGIKENQLGELDIQVIPSDLAYIDSWQDAGLKIAFNVNASKAGSGEVLIKHLSSNKELSIPLYIENKATTATVKGQQVVVNIPEANYDNFGNLISHNYNLFTIDSSSLISCNGTDNVVWAVSSNTILPNGVELGYFNADLEAIEPNEHTPMQFKVSSDCLGGVVKLIPILTMTGYPDIVLDFEIDVNFIKVLDENSINILSKDAIGITEDSGIGGLTDFKSIIGNIVLFHNSASYNSSELSLFYGDIDILSNPEYKNVYNIIAHSSTSKLSASSFTNEQGENTIKIVGLDYSVDLAQLIIDFTPKNAVGDIKSFSKVVNVDLSEVATRIDAIIDGEKATIQYDEDVAILDVELLDYYAKYNNMGQKFNFEVYKTTTDISLRNMIISLDVNMLSTNNAIYNEHNGLVTLSPTNNYLLEFRKGSGYMKFYLLNSTLYSEPFNASDNIYIKYIANANPTLEENLKFEVYNTYNSYFYGENAIVGESKTLNINVNRSRGVKEINVSGTYLTSDGENMSFGSNECEYVYSSRDKIYAIADVLTSIDGESYKVKEGLYVYGVSIDEVIGESSMSDKEKTNIIFEATITKKGDEINDFILGLFSQANNSIKLLNNGEFNITLSEDKIYNAILLFRKSDEIGNGEYLINISQKLGGYVKSFSYNVVANVESANLLVEPFTIDGVADYRDVYLGSNYVDDGYYSNSFIIPTTKEFNTSIKTGYYSNNEFVEDVGFRDYVDNVSVQISTVKFTNLEQCTTENIVLETSVNYMEYRTMGLLGEINFAGKLSSGLYGTVFQGEKYYIKVSFVVESKKYEVDANNFYVLSAELNQAVVDYYFFIYVPVTETKFAGNVSVANAYYHEDLGYYYKEQGQKTLTIDLPNINETAQSVFDYVDYVWINDDSLTDVTILRDNSKHSTTFTFKIPSSSSRTVINIPVKVTQYGVQRVFSCKVYISRPKITEQIVVRNSLNLINNEKYAYLKVGDSFAFDVEKVGDYSFSEISYVVCDLAGNVSKDYKIVDGKLVNISDNTEIISVAKDLKILIFSTDWLSKSVDSSLNVYNFNDLTEYLINKSYLAKVQIVGIKIRDGSETKPFLLSTSDDIKALSQGNNKYYYELVNDINMNNLAVNLGSFSGDLSSYKDYKLLTQKPEDWEDNYAEYYTYSSLRGFEKIGDNTAPAFTYRTYYRLNQNKFTIYNIKLADALDNQTENTKLNNSYYSTSVENFALFDKVAKEAKISNITFKVNFTETLTNFASSNIGVIGENYGGLINVNVEFSGKLTIQNLNSSKNINAINIGGLVGQNAGYISAQDESSIVANGNLVVENITAAKICFGGYIGYNFLNKETENSGKIIGTLPTAILEVEYALYFENQGAMFGGEIQLIDENLNSAIGGLIGYNYYGILENIYTSGRVIGKNNVGGIIGKNESEKIDQSASETYYTIKNSQSTTIIDAESNVGGVTGYDDYGMYYLVNYEVYNSNVETDASISGITNVGGLVGYGNLIKMKYCYFHSFKWSYVNDATIDFTESEYYSKMADIVVKDLVGESTTPSNAIGGLVGYLRSDSIDNTGAQEVKSYIENSSVDAYILGTQTSGLVGYAYNYPSISNAYVIGAVVNENQEVYKNARVYTKQADGTMLEDSINSIEKNTYFVVYGQTSTGIIALLDSYKDNALKFNDFTAFAQSVEVNNGRHYLIYINKPLITQAPTSIDLSSALTAENISDRASMNLIDANGNPLTENDKILIYFYDLINEGQFNFSNDKLINQISLDEFILKSKIIIQPANIGARLKVVSSDTSVISVLMNGNIQIYKEGVATLTFSSIINPSIKAKITIVTRAVPSDYEIYKNSTLTEDDILNGNFLNIIKNESKFIYEKYSGVVIINNTKYNYKTTSEIRLEVVVKNLAGEYVADSVIEINGELIDEKDLYGNPIFEKVLIDNLTPIIISVKGFSDEVYVVEITPYIKLKINNTEYLYKFSDRTFSFEINTKQGVTLINSNISDATISVADDLNIELTLATDTTINQVETEIKVVDQNGQSIQIFDNSGNKIGVEELFILTLEGEEENRLFYNEENQKLYLNLYSSADLSNNQQTEMFILKINDKVCVEKDLFVTLTLKTGEKNCQINLTLIPQRITAIVASNYKEGELGWLKSNIIRSGDANMIVIDVAPDTAYFDYLEITDTYSQEKIKFTQFDSFNSEILGFGESKALNTLDKPSSDGYGIRLVKVEGNKSFYVYSLLSLYALENASHKIVITAYSSSGYVLGITEFTIQSVIYPSIKLDYYNAKGIIAASSDSRELATTNIADLAVGVEAKIGVEIHETEGDISWQVLLEDSSGGYKTTNQIKVIQNGAYYYLTWDKTLDTQEELQIFIGHSIKVVATVGKYTNGYLETSSTELIFNLRLFTINGITIKTSKNGLENAINGIIKEKEILEFYFNETDISFYNNGYWNKVYNVDFNSTDENDYINELLKAINNLNSEKGGIVLKILSTNIAETILWSKNTESEINTYSYQVDGVTILEFEKAENEFIKITANASVINSYKFLVGLNLTYDANGIPALVQTGNVTVNAEYNFNFVETSSLYNYTPIGTALEFNAMVDTGYYILTSDITLTNYLILDKKLGGFDGNGHTITIESFAYATMASNAGDGVGYFGLFKQIYEGEIIKNVTLIYKIDYNVDLCEEPIAENTYFSEIYIGGIAPINNGIITNCVVNGSINFSASKIAPSAFKIGGIVCENNDGAYITNTSSKLNIKAGGYVGGFVFNNLGKIVSSSFTGSIDAYSTSSLSNTINTAGFVVENAGEISMSYVSKDEEVDMSGNINTPGSFGGFVYNNSGKVYDCYLSNITFTSRGEAGGFVHTSTGSIERCFVNMNTNLQGDRSKDAFVFVKTSGTFTDCYFVMSTLINSSVNGVSCIETLSILNKEKYKNYQFSDDTNGVWSMSQKGPVLNSAYSLIKKKSSTTSTVNGKETINFIISGTKEIPYVIYNAETYQYYMQQGVNNKLYGYYRLVADIDLGSVDGNPITSNYSFSGMMEGNNMTISNFELHTANNYDALGLFKEIVQTPQKSSFINHLTISVNRVRGSNTSAVGILAGVIDGGYLYNVTIDSANIVVSGKNAVGGLAGIIKGSYKIDGIKSNVSANSVYRHTVGSQVNLYLSKMSTGLSSSNNLSSVSYAGAIAGIVDGYDTRVNSSVKLENYYKIQNCVVNGAVILIGETVGGAFGLVTERSYLENITINVLDGTYLKGVYYSGGVVGENRGVINKATIKAPSEKVNLFDANLEGTFANVNGGIVAVNYGGLIYKSTNNSNVISYNSLATVGGIVGRNNYGTIYGSVNTGFVYGLFAGGISGTDYSTSTLNAVNNGSGSITQDTKKVLPTQVVDYSNLKLENGVIINPLYRYQAINVNAIDSWFMTQANGISSLEINLNDYYYAIMASEVYNVRISHKLVLGAIVGLTDNYYSCEVLTISQSQYELNMILTNKDIIENSFDDNNIYRDKLVTNIANLTDDSGEKYSSLQEKIKGNINIQYFYFVAITNATYDFVNLNNGYSQGYVKIVEN